jgi:hypothetical protein
VIAAKLLSEDSAICRVANDSIAEHGSDKASLARHEAYLRYCPLFWGMGLKKLLSGGPAVFEAVLYTLERRYVGSYVAYMAVMNSVTALPTVALIISERHLSLTVFRSARAAILRVAEG